MKNLRILNLFALLALRASVFGAAGGGQPNGSTITGITASQIAFTQAGTGATATNLDAINKNRPLNAKTDFNAKGDGTTDDTPALQSALDAGKAAKRPVYIPAGTYKLTAALVENWSGMVIFGDGSQLTVLKQYGATAHGLSIPANPNDYMSIHGLGIIYAGTAGTSTGTGLNIVGTGNSADNGYYYDLDVEGFTTGIEANAVANSVFVNVQANYNTGDQIHVEGNSNSLNFICCDVGILTGATGWHLTSGRGISIQGGDMNSTGTGICALQDGANNVTFQGSNVEAASSVIPFQFTSANTYNKLVNMTIGNSGGSFTYGVQVTNGASVYIDSCSLYNNIVRQDGSTSSHNVSTSQNNLTIDTFVTGSKVYGTTLSKGALSTTTPAFFIDPGNAAGNIQGGLQWGKGSIGGRSIEIRKGQTGIDNLDFYYSSSETMSSPSLGLFWVTATNTWNMWGSLTLGPSGHGTNITGIRHGLSGAMVAGAVTVSDPYCTANTRYFFTAHTLGTVTFPSAFYASTRTASTSFVITASQITDTSTVDWEAIEP